MVRLISKLILERIVVRCATKRPRSATMMPKRSLHNPPEKKLKPNQNSISPTKSMSEHNLSDNSVLTVEGRAEALTSEVHVEPQQRNERIKVEYLEAPVKSEKDKKDYRVIKLQNGLTALLISDLHSLGAASQGDDEDEDKVDEITSENEDKDDEGSSSEEDDEDDESGDEDDEDDEEEEGFRGRKGSGEIADSDDTESSKFQKRAKKEEKMAACGLCVGVGSFSDPPEIQGMAHFLEHMVFMGSEKYPEENDFDAFIKRRGGSDNASTECEQTTFYFEVQEKHLLASLDRFAQFFIKPLMKRDAITREREAVESEFQMVLPSDFYRKEQLFCSLARPNHPASKFSCGNLITLRDNVTDDKLYEELHKFRERHYSAHRMTMAIQARLPLDSLEDYVTQCFSNVPSNALPPDDFTEFKGADSFNTPDFRKIYKIKPIKDVCQIELTWAMPPLHDLYKSKPHQYVSWIIGNEGKGSLISYLRKKMWCLDIFSGNGESGFEHSSMYALFSLSLILTDEGHKHLEEVLNAVFSYINLMRRMGPQQIIFDEIEQIEENNFRFAEEMPAAEYVEDLCENMHFYPPRDYITGNDLYFEYHPEAIQMCMDILTPDDVNIMIFDKKFNDDEFDKLEPWFKTKYAVTDIPQEWIECWRTIEPLSEFHLPLPNPFVTDDFTMIPLPAEILKYPTKVYSDEISEVWYRPDPKFGLPECYMYFYLISPMSIASPKHAALMDLFVAILKQLLVEELYPATAAELNHQIYTSDKGIVIKVNGFNQKLPLLLTTITKCMAECSTLVKEDLFDIMKREQIKEYYNTFLKPKKLVKDIRLSILMLVHWSAMDKHAAIGTVDFQEFVNFAQYFTKHVYIQSLVQGNMTIGDTIKNVRNAIGMLNCGPLLPNTAPCLRVSQLPLGTHYCKVRNFNETDVNSNVTNYYQSGIGSIKLSVITELVIMLMEEPLFNRLRTQEQLGYNVFCLLRDTYDIIGYSVTVCTQADKYTTEYVDERIEKFLEVFCESLGKTPEKEWESVKEALIKQKQCADIHLKEEVSRNWAEITTGKYMFNRIENELAVIETVTIDELREWMKNHTLNGSNLRKLSVQAIGKPEKQADSNSQDVEIQEPDTERSTFKKAENGVASYPLMYVSDPEADKASGHYIKDIHEFKLGLYIYPSSTDTAL